MEACTQQHLSCNLSGQSFSQTIYSLFSVGSDAGVGFVSQYCLEEDIIINVLSNRTNGSEERVRFILEALRNKT
jgi:hypothetical protein